MHDYFLHFLNKKYSKNYAIQIQAFRCYRIFLRAKVLFINYLCTLLILIIFKYYDVAIYYAFALITLKSVISTNSRFYKKEAAKMLFLLIIPVKINRINLINGIRFWRKSLISLFFLNSLNIFIVIQIIVFLMHNHNYWVTIVYIVFTIIYYLFFVKEFWFSACVAHFSHAKKVILKPSFYKKFFRKSIRFTENEKGIFFTPNHKWRLLFVPLKPLLYLLLFLASLKIASYIFYKYGYILWLTGGSLEDLLLFLFMGFFLKIVVEPILIRLHKSFRKSSFLYFKTIFFRGSSIESELLFERCILPIFGAVGKTIILTNSKYKDLHENNRFEKRPELEAEYREAKGYMPYFVRQEGMFLKLEGLNFLVPIPNIPFFLSLFTQGEEFYCKTENWKRVVTNQLKKMDFAILYLNSQSESLIWECQQVSKYLPDNRVLLIKKKKTDTPKIENVDLKKYKLITFTNNYLGRYILICKICLYMFRQKLS